MTALKASREFKSPNFLPTVIPVEFLIIHYTACDLDKTMEIFTDPTSKVAAHFVVAEDGRCFDLGGFRNDRILKGAHAGNSRLDLGGQNYEAFNEFSVGVELVNLNGNLFEFTELQYESLCKLIRELQNLFPALKDASRIIGHEHIAGWRGKSDPGVKFDWVRLFDSLGPARQGTHQTHACTKEDIEFLESSVKLRNPINNDPDFWPSLNEALEKRIANRVKQ